MGRGSYVRYEVLGCKKVWLCVVWGWWGVAAGLWLYVAWGVTK